MADILFDVADSLSKVYPALSPFAIRRERFAQVLRTVSNLNLKSRREDGIGRNDRITYDNRGNRIIWKEAKNDDWW